MFSSRAEHRLLLRQDNADRRLVLRGHGVGLVDDVALQRLEEKEAELERLRVLAGELRDGGGRSLLELLKRPDVTFESLLAEQPELAAAAFDVDVLEAVEIDVKYAGYIERQEQNVARLARQEATLIPGELDYAGIQGLASEAREKLERLRPRTLGAASRIDGVRPPDVALLAIHVERRRRG